MVQYDFGKTGPDGQTRIGTLDAPPRTLLNALAKMRENDHRGLRHFSTHLSTFDRVLQFSRERTCSDILFQPNYCHTQGQMCEGCDKVMIIERAERANREVVIHYSTIASRNRVMKEGTIRHRISSELGVLCFEMEVAGLLSTFPYVVIRGISDYADSHKNNNVAGSHFRPQQLQRLPKNCCSSHQQKS